MTQQALGIKGWPLTDPYPYRDHDWPPVYTKETDCDYVLIDKNTIKTWTDDEDPDYEYLLRQAWGKINSLCEELQQAKCRIQWLENVGGEGLNIACGVDIICREMVIKKEAEEATP